MPRTNSMNDDLKVLATSALLLIDAMVFHEIISRSDENIRTLGRIRLDDNIKRALEDEWKKILQTDYKPVFEHALNILLELPASNNVNNGLKHLVDIAYNIASSNVLLKHDLFGRIYHRLLLGKLIKYYATLYTSIPAARLLAKLLINLPSPLNISEDEPKYGDEPLRIVDFACGSGTLLSAVYKELELRYRLEAVHPDMKKLHKYLIEEGIWGFDVLQHAAHLALTTLFLHEPSQPVMKSRIYALRLGKIGQNIFLGSIDFLRERKIKKQMLISGGEIGATRMGIEKQETPEEEIPNYHISIMNPPFTRSVGGNLLFGGLPENERKELQKELSKLLKEKGLSGIGQAGLGALFVFLADKYLEPSGRIGLVLPKGILAGISWRKVRELLTRKYHLEYVISSFEGPNDWNFSENTSLSEVLLVARKLRENEKPGYTVFVNLWVKPKSEIEAISIGSQLLEIYNSKIFDIDNSNATPYNLKLKGKKIGEAFSALLTDTDIGHYSLFAQAELNRVVTLLRKGLIYSPVMGISGYIPLTKFEKLIVHIGPDVRQIHEAFTQGEGRYKAFWDHDSQQVKTINQSSNRRLTPRPGKNDSARNLWTYRGKILIAERIRLNTHRTLSIHINEDVVSNVWWPIKSFNDTIEKLITLWLNSTYGIILMLSIAETTEGAWIKFKKSSLYKLPILDFNKLKKDKIEKLLQTYEKVKNKEFKPFPIEFKNPIVRKEIDKSFNEVLNVDIDLHDIYDLLSRDPTITNKPLVP